METINDLQDFWKQNTGKEPNDILNNTEVKKIIKERIIKEKKRVAEYFWLALIFQIFIYSFACNLFIRYWGDTMITMSCLAGVVFYIPFTVLLLRKYKAMYSPVSASTEDIKSGVSNQYKLLTQFFVFKKRFDLVLLPINALVLTIILFKLYVPGGIAAHMPLAIISCLVMLLAYSIAALFENKKHFVKPLRRFEWILQDIENNS